MSVLRSIERHVSYPPRICALPGCGKKIPNPWSKRHKFCSKPHAQRAANIRYMARAQKALKLARKNGDL